jgi:hypothetical protein
LKTHKGLIEKVSKVLGNGNVIHHEPTEENQIGQSGVHTFVSDIMDVIEDINGPLKEPSSTWKELMKFLITKN